VKAGTRAQSQQRTRILLVDAATTLFLRDGFRATSLEQIGDEAGFTRGAVYSNFDSKTAIGLAVIDGMYDRVAQQLEAAVTAVPDGDAWFDQLAAVADKTIRDPAWTRLEIEVGAAATNDDAYRAATAARYARLRAFWARLLEQQFGSTLLDPEALAGILLAFALGAGVQRAADPTLTVSSWVTQLRALIPRS
jgi:AcrR family transcriptional regulator